MSFVLCNSSIFKAGMSFKKVKTYQLFKVKHIQTLCILSGAKIPTSGQKQNELMQSEKLASFVCF